MFSSPNIPWQNAPKCSFCPSFVYLDIGLGPRQKNVHVLVRNVTAKNRNPLVTGSTSDFREVQWLSRKGTTKTARSFFSRVTNTSDSTTRVLERSPLWLCFGNSSRGTFQIHSFQGSFFSGNHQKPRLETDPVFGKRTMVEKNGQGINP